VNVLSGDTGTGKSYFTLGLVVAALRGEPWLGREVRAERMLVSTRRTLSA
jgi:RecA-family ATPase